MEKKLHQIQFDLGVDYIQREYRKSIFYPKDYETLEKIFNKYSAQEIVQAIQYCKKQNTDSLIYLEKCLFNKYYESVKSSKVPEWIQNPELCKQSFLNEADKEWARKFYKKYCETADEYEKKIMRNGLRLNV